MKVFAIKSNEIVRTFESRNFSANAQELWVQETQPQTLDIFSGALDYIKNLGSEFLRLSHRTWAQNFEFRTINPLEKDHKKGCGTIIGWKLHPVF